MFIGLRCLAEKRRGYTRLTFCKNTNNFSRRKKITLSAFLLCMGFFTFCPFFINPLYRFCNFSSAIRHCSLIYQRETKQKVDNFLGMTSSGLGRQNLRGNRISSQISFTQQKLLFKVVGLPETLLQLKFINFSNTEKSSNNIIHFNSRPQYQLLFSLT